MQAQVGTMQRWSASIRTSFCNRSMFIFIGYYSEARGCTCWPLLPICRWISQRKFINYGLLTRIQIPIKFMSPMTVKYGMQCLTRPTLGRTQTSKPNNAFKSSQFCSQTDTDSTCCNYSILSAMLLTAFFSCAGAALVKTAKVRQKFV